jgi:hypothetical protein
MSTTRRRARMLKKMGIPLEEGSAMKVSIIDSNIIIETSSNHVCTEQVGCLSKLLM